MQSQRAIAFELGLGEALVSERVVRGLCIAFLIAVDIEGYEPLAAQRGFEVDQNAIVFLVGTIDITVADSAKGVGKPLLVALNLTFAAERKTHPDSGYRLHRGCGDVARDPFGLCLPELAS